MSFFIPYPRIICRIIIILLIIFTPTCHAFPIDRTATRELEAKPFATLNSQYGFSYGLMGKNNKPLQLDDSMTGSVYFSLNGDRGAAFIYSIPDKEIIKGAAYPVAFDLIEEFGHNIGERYYGIGSRTSGNNYSTFTNDHNRTTLQFSHGLTEKVTLQEGVYFYNNRFSDIEEGRYFVSSEARDDLIDYTGGNISLSYDDRNDIIEPSSGIYCIAMSGFGLNGADYFRAGVDLRRYDTPFNDEQVFASRILLTQMSGPNIPLYEYASLGGNDTLRGYFVGRFRDKSAAFVNFEYRIPTPIDFYFLEGLSTVFFYEAGKVGESLASLGLDDWSSDIGIGLHLNVSETMMLRGDVGIGTEGVNFCITCNQAF